MQELLNECNELIAVRTNGTTHLRHRESGRLLFVGTSKECVACLRGIIIAKKGV